MQLLLGATLLVLILLAVAVLTAGAVALVRRDRNHGASGAMSAAFLEVQSLLEPSKQHVLEAVRAEDEDEESLPGGPPESGA